jgi:hypothetical protein
MDHMTPELLTGNAGFSKTLFMSPPGHDGVLVTCRGEKISSRHKKFSDAHAALDWCEKNSANFSYVMPQNPGSN